MMRPRRAAPCHMPRSQQHPSGTRLWLTLLPVRSADGVLVAVVVPQQRVLQQLGMHAGLHGSYAQLCRSEATVQLLQKQLASAARAGGLEVRRTTAARPTWQLPRSADAAEAARAHHRHELVRSWPAGRTAAAVAAGDQQHHASASSRAPQETETVRHVLVEGVPFGKQSARLLTPTFKKRRGELAQHYAKPIQDLLARKVAKRGSLRAAVQVSART